MTRLLMEGMWVGDWKELIDRLREDTANGDSVDCEVMAREIVLPLDRLLRPIFIEWMHTGEYDTNFALLDWTISDIKKHNMCSTAEAFYWMDMLCRNPERALHFLNGPATTVRVINWRLPRETGH